MKFLQHLKVGSVVAVCFLLCGVACVGNASQEGGVENAPCDTVIVTYDTTISVTDTLYVNPADTSGMDSVFTND